VTGPSDGNLVGLIGAGPLGHAIAGTARRTGRGVVIVNSRGPDSVASVASVVSALGEGVSAGTVDEAASAGIGGGQRVIFLSGNDADAKAEVVALFRDAGFAAIDLGDLKTGGEMQQIHHPLAGVNLIRL
jgi:predicted dinucleotide-binding enzyme